MLQAQVEQRRFLPLRERNVKSGTPCANLGRLTMKWRLALRRPALH
jgi:hypothetical protein